MSVERFKITFNINEDGGHDACTLLPSCVGANDSGWVVDADIQEDYFEWVNKFRANHPVYGVVWGDFEKVVYASNKEAYEHFTEHHPAEQWDYWDI